MEHGTGTRAWPYLPNMRHPPPTCAYFPWNTCCSFIIHRLSLDNLRLALSSPCPFTGSHLQPDLKAFCAHCCSLSLLCFSGAFSPNKSLLLLTATWHLLLQSREVTTLQEGASVFRWVTLGLKNPFLIQNWEMINDCYIITSSKICQHLQVIMLTEDIKLYSGDIDCFWNIQVITHTSSPGGVLWHIWATALWAEVTHFHFSHKHRRRNVF